MNSLTYHQQIEKGFKDWRVPLYFSKPVLRHLLLAVESRIRRELGYRQRDLLLLSIKESLML
jgi:hypothetical protein